MPLHDFILPKPHTNSTVFDFLVIFCSFYVYSLVPGVWHPVFSGVNALSGLYLISTEKKLLRLQYFGLSCQCPLGLIPHFYAIDSVSELKYALCQCPLGLIPHFYVTLSIYTIVANACQCPLGLIPHFYTTIALI